MQKFDAIIIGAGQSGMPLAKKIGSLGKKVALIEKRVVGGTCINDGCSPTKTMVASARVAHLVSRASDFGIEVPNYSVDQKKIKARKDHIVELFRGGAEKALVKAENVTIIIGMARFTDCRKVEVIHEGKVIEELEAEHVFIDTGAQPIIPNVEGIEEVPYLNSTTIMELEETPEHLVIMGGGYIGLEFAQMFRRFGSQVTILDNGPRLVPKEDEDVCEEVSRIFQEEGISTSFNSNVVKVSKDGPKLEVTYIKEGQKETVHGSHLLVAVGRRPSTDKLQLEKSNIETDEKGDILVDEYHETSCKGVFALGDVVGETPFTHMAYHDAHTVFKCVYEKEKISKVDRLMPYCIFIDPQLARVGLNEQQAKAKGIPYEVGKYWMKHAGRPLEVDEKRGFFKVLVNPENRMILGATILSIDGGEIIAAIQMAMLGGITADVIQHLPIAHPTLAENLNNVMGMIGKDNY
ncbi:mercuric reductase [Litoribacter alkaliphilus]|uniref:Mercuric reductase n=1 Tax=Litoribacter ruber TaxID=702568 RepID=A0AAP2CGQ6_9BACT|nr:mercuric reductase [Litoribacter alkaliphilus]MBS9524326.1 mercuric reductase [Litoribacter alkaliphilus]